MSFLNVNGLSTNYGPVKAVKGVSLSVGRGEMVGVIGRNGAGKSTLMKSICGLVKPAGGSVVLDGQRIDGKPAHQVLQSGVAYVPEGRRVFGDMSVADNLKIGAFSKFTTGASKDVPRLLDRVYSLFPVLSERAEQLAGTLSGGQQQMLAIGRALMSDPKLLLLDEPSMGLAPIIFHELFDAIVDLNKAGMTILVVEQKAYLTLRMINRGYVLTNGHVTIEGTGAELLKNREVQDAYLGQSSGAAGKPSGTKFTTSSAAPQAKPVPPQSLELPPSPHVEESHPMHKPATFSARSATLTALASRRSALTSSLDQRFLPQSAPKATGRNGLPSVTRSGQAGSPATALTTTREAAMLKSHRDQPKKK